MNDPYLLLGLPEDVTDEQVRAAYHRQLRLHPPEQSPERFAAISEAYETVRTLEDRVRHRVFGMYSDAQCLGELVADVDRRLPTLPAAVWIGESQRLWLRRQVDRDDTHESKHE